MLDRSGTWRVGAGVLLVSVWVLVAARGAWAETAYVADSGSGTLTPIEVSSNTAGNPIKVGSGPTAVALTPNGKTLYVANRSSDTVTPIEVATNKPGPEMKVGLEPDAVAITPNGKTVYVANWGSDTVTPITVATNKVGKEIALGSGGEPHAIVVTPNGKTVYVVNFGFEYVVAIETATNKKVGEINVGEGPRSIALTPDGKTAYVTSAIEGTVVPIETTTDKVETAIKIGKEPEGIAITPNGDTAYVTLPNSGTVVPIELATRQLSAPITVGFDPNEIAITPDGLTAYITNLGPEIVGVGSYVTTIELGPGTAGPDILVGRDPVGIAISKGATVKTSNHKYCASKTEPVEIGPSEVTFKPCMTVTDAYNGTSAYNVSILPPANSTKAGGCPQYIAHLDSSLACTVTGSGSYASGSSVTDYVNMDLEWDNSTVAGPIVVTELETDTMKISVTTSAKGQHTASSVVTFGSKQIITTDSAKRGE